MKPKSTLMKNPPKMMAGGSGQYIILKLPFGSKGDFALC